MFQGIYGFFLSFDVAYYTYIYAKVSRDHYQQVTGYARSAFLAGRSLSAGVAQIMISFKLMDSSQLNYISLAALILATFWALFLPTPSRSVYFNQEIIALKQKQENKFKQAFKLLWKHFINSYSNFHVIKWSLWWSIATCISLQLEKYSQPLFSAVRQSEEGDYTGAVECVAMLLGSSSAFVAGNIKTNWNLRREILLTVCSLIIGGALIFASQTQFIAVSYTGYVVFIMLYQFMVTIASSEVAKHISEDTYGLVFGLNTLLALILQTILTLIVVDGGVGLGFSPRNQFVVYGGYFFVLAIIYFVFGIFTSTLCNKKLNADP